jgi:uncharacterized OB-fold protein
MTFHVPSPDVETQAWWDAAREHRLLIKRCSACGRPHFYPRPFCPFCWSDDVDWEQASGRASLYTWSVVHRNDLPPFHERVPYVAAIVELEEGPRMATNIEGCGPGDLKVGMAVEVGFRDEGAVVVPVFRPAGRG